MNSILEMDVSTQYFETFQKLRHLEYYRLWIFLQGIIQGIISNFFRICLEILCEKRTLSIALAYKKMFVMHIV